MKERKILWKRTSGAGKFLIIVYLILIVLGISLSFKFEYIDEYYDLRILDVEYLFGVLRRAAFFCLSFILFLLWNFIPKSNKSEVYLLIIYVIINFMYLIYWIISILIRPTMPFLC